MPGFHYYNWNTDSRRRREMARYVIPLLISVFIITAFPGRKNNPPERSFANVIIDTPGEYGSPDGAFYVEIKEENEGELDYIIVLDKGDTTEITCHYSPFKADSGWFMCWDSQNRLWVHTPDLERCHFCFWGLIEGDIVPCFVGDGEGMDGVPRPFLARLPSDAREAYEAYSRKQPSGEAEIPGKP